MPHRDPSTGQFVSDDGEQFDDIEVATFGFNGGVQAADANGITTYQGESFQVEGIEIFDYDDLVDRNEELVLLAAAHRLSAYINSTATEDGSANIAAEVSASPSITGPTIRAGRALTNSFDSGDVVGGVGEDDTIDVLGRPLVATAMQPFFDSTTGAGGGGSAGEDSVELEAAPAEFGRFHPRDELFLNAQLSVNNVQDAGVHLAVSGQHLYGVMED